jgi:hypothetical protein
MPLRSAGALVDTVGVMVTLYTWRSMAFARKGAGATTVAPAVFVLPFTRKRAVLRDMNLLYFC